MARNKTWSEYGSLCLLLPINGNQAPGLW
jgi:hypothetical protein